MKGVQSQLASDHLDTELHDSERVIVFKLKKFLGAQEIAYRKKSRVQWLHDGDSNFKFFFSLMKERQNRNNIDILYDSTGKKLEKTEDIKAEISSFYKELIGTAATRLTGIDV